MEYDGRGIGDVVFGELGFLLSRRLGTITIAFALSMGQGTRRKGSGDADRVGGGDGEGEGEYEREGAEDVEHVETRLACPIWISFGAGSGMWREGRS